MARPRLPRLVQPREAFSGDIDGEMFVVNPRENFRDDHPIVLKFPDRFVPARESRPVPHVEQMTAGPGEMRDTDLA